MKRMSKKLLFTTLIILIICALTPASSILASGKEEAGGGKKGVEEMEYQYVKWYEDGSADIITFEDKEVIHFTKKQLGTLLGPGKKPYEGKRIAIVVYNGGPKGGISGPMHRLRPAWEELTGAKLDIVETPLTEIVNKTINDLRLGTNQFDGVMQGAWYMGEYAYPGYLKSTEEYLGDPKYPYWDTEWMPEPLATLHKWEGKWYGVLNDSDGFVLYYRRDILSDPEWQKKYRQETGEDMPYPIETWDDVIAIARFFNGKNYDDSDPDPDSGVVFHYKSGGQGFWHFMVMSAPYTVVQGGNKYQGATNYWFDPDTMKPMINQPGHVRALEDLLELSKYGPEAQISWGLGAAWDWWLRGKAIFGQFPGDVGSLAQDPDRSNVKGKLGIQHLPGVNEVYDLQNKRWIKSAKPNIALSAYGGHWHGVIFSTSKNPDVTYHFLAMMATEPFSLYNVNRGWTGVDPGANIHYLPPLGSASLEGYLAEGWNEDDLRQYLGAYYDTFHGDAYMTYLRISGTEEYFRTLDDFLLEALLGRMSAKEALDATAKKWEEITNRRGREDLKAQYRQSVGL